LVSRLNIRNPIIYTGDVNGDEVLNYYKLFNISVLASTTDGFGLVLLESMAMNCPVVATDFGGIRDVVKNEWNGLLFEDQKVQQLAFALQRLLTDNKLRTKLVENGYVTAHQVFVMENTLASYEQFYREVYRDRVLRYKPANKAITFTE
jgi:glycosyltransferase involved in cell wall biosynthesis